MELYQLKLFVDLAEKKNFTQVANENYVTQAAVTLQIRKLESELGVPLFHRTTRAVTLLEAGNRLLPYATQMLKHAEEAKESVRETKTEISGLVRVASVHSVGLYELPPYVKRFLQKYPDVNLRIEYRTSDDIYRELLAGDIDVGIVAYPNEMSRVETRPFTTDELAIICMKDHPFAKNRSINLQELEGQNFVQFTEETPTRQATDAVLSENGITVNVRTECDNIEILKQMVEIGYGIALLPRSSITANDRERGLRLLDLKDHKIERPLGILLLKNAPRFRAMRAFVEVLTTPPPAEN